MKALNDLIRIHDIAERAKTSIGTVDRVIHNRSGVAEKTRQRVMEVLKEFNYKPNLIARRLASKDIFKIAVLLPVPSISFWKIHPEGIRKAADEVKPFGVEVDSFTFEFNSKEEYIRNLSLIKDGNYDAMLAVPVFYEEIVAFIRETKIVTVFFDANIDGERDVNSCFIGEDAYQSGKVGGKLLSPGFQYGDSLLIIAIGNKSQSHLRWIERESGVKDFFLNARSDLQIESSSIIKIELSELDDKSIEEKISMVFKDHPRITRVFINSCRATSLCAPFFEQAKKFRRDLKIVGYDLTDENIFHLKNGTIDFLINKHPKEQCYHGIKMIYEYLVLRIPIPAKTLMPIDIIIKENVDHYKMLQVKT
jgi:LacI family transcriptional regulator